MRVTGMIAAAFAASCLAPTVGAAQTTTPRPAPTERPGAETPRQPMTRGQESDDQEFVRKAIAGNQKEIELGRFAATRASNAEVKAFAEKMVADHTKTLEKLKSVAGTWMTSSTSGAAGTTAGTSGTTTGTAGTTGTTGTTAGTSGTTAGTTASGTDTPAAQSGVPAKLANLQGAEFDRAYMEEMVDGHEDMIDLLEDQAEDGKDAQLKQFAADTLPAVREHLQLARSLRDKVKGS